LEIRDYRFKDKAWHESYEFSRIIGANAKEKVECLGVMAPPLYSTITTQSQRPELPSSCSLVPAKESSMKCRSAKSQNRPSSCAPRTWMRADGKVDGTAAETKNQKNHAKKTNRAMAYDPFLVRKLRQAIAKLATIAGDER